MTDGVPSYLQKHQPRAAATQEELHKMAAAAWHTRHVLLVPMDDPSVIIDDIHRQACENVGNKLYGARVKP